MVRNKKQVHSQLKSKLKKAEQLEKTVKSKGYKEFISPLIDRMIEDIDAQVSSKKKNGIWYQGVNATPKNIKDNDYYARLFYYKQALIDLSNRVTSQVKSIENLKKSITKLETEPETKKKTPYKHWG